MANNKRYGSAKIESQTSNKVVAIVNEDNRGGAGIPVERVGQGSTYNAMPNGSQTVHMVFPQVPSKAGGIYSGGVQVMNTTGTATTCTINFTDDANANAVLNLPANDALSIFAPTFPGTAPYLVDAGYNKGVDVVCGQPIVGIANMAVEVNTGKLGDSFTTSNGLNLAP